MGQQIDLLGQLVLLLLQLELLLFVKMEHNDPKPCCAVATLIASACKGS